jgi:hypothetical protein
MPLYVGAWWGKCEIFLIGSMCAVELRFCTSILVNAAVLVLC